MLVMCVVVKVVTSPVAIDSVTGTVVVLLDIGHVE